MDAPLDNQVSSYLKTEYVVQCNLWNRGSSDFGAFEIRENIFPYK